MELIQKLYLGFGTFTILTLTIYVAMNFYLSKYHLKIMDKIVYGQVSKDDNFIHKAMRTIEYIGFLTQKRLRERLPLETQKKIMALDKKFRRPFMIQWGLWIVLMIIMIIIFIMEFLL